MKTRRVCSSVIYRVKKATHYDPISNHKRIPENRQNTSGSLQKS